MAAAAATAAARQEAWGGVLDQHPSIQYAARPTADRVAALNRALAHHERALARDPRTGYLNAVLQALDIPAESQLLVFSKTGVQRALTGPHHPRALYFDRSAAVGYVPGAPVIEVAAHDPQQGVVFYTLDQAADPPIFTRRTTCLACHVSASTLDVPGIIARSNIVDDEGNVMPQLGSYDVDHRTPHPDRWGGWFVTSEDGPAPYSQRAHGGNITFSGRGNTSNQVFIDWMTSAPESHGYLSGSSDIVGLLVFDHQMHAINLLTRLNWEARIASADGAAPERAPAVRDLATELADYFLFVDEAPPSVPLSALAGFARHLEAQTPKDRRGRSFGQLDLVNRLVRYPCSYMIYAEAFDALPAGVKSVVYRRMIDTLSGAIVRRNDYHAPTAETRLAVLEILRDTKPGFPAS